MTCDPKHQLHAYLAEPVRVLQTAAAELGVGTTTLKRICRENDVLRWPYRKRRALATQINKTVDILENDGTQGAHTAKMAPLVVVQKIRDFRQKNML